MAAPEIPTHDKLIALGNVAKDPQYKGLRIVRYQSDPAAHAAYTAQKFEFQHEPQKRHEIASNSRA
jgi:hypothetical protein